MIKLCPASNIDIRFLCQCNIIPSYMQFTNKYIYRPFMLIMVVVLSFSISIYLYIHLLYIFCDHKLLNYFILHQTVPLPSWTHSVRLSTAESHFLLRYKRYLLSPSQLILNLRIMK